MFYQIPMFFLIVGLIKFGFLFSLFGMAVFGLNSFVLTLLYLRSSRREAPQPTLPQDESLWPPITVQLPVYNERYMVKRLLKSITALDYPRQRLQIQVLDDSTDLTTHIASRLVAEYQSQGFDIQLLHRDQRTGYKAGALAAGLEQATGELVAIFDADFIPGPGWLRLAVPEFSDPRLGCLQTRWGHTNRDYNLLTLTQALGIDGHFIVEQTARSRSGLFLNFNGTAGIWRRAAIEDAGGWQADTLTEDLDLSYRAQLRGWRIGYRPDILVPAELPAQVEAFKSQQFRWAKGSMQTLRKLVPRLFSEEVPWTVRLGALIHLSGYAVQPLMLMMLLLTLPVASLANHFQHLFTWTSLIALGPPFLYSVTRTESTPRLRDRLRILPLLILLGFGLSLNNSIAVIQGLLGHGGEFHRTPKFNLPERRAAQAAAPGDRPRGGWIGSAYALPHSPMVWGELALAVYALVTIIILWPTFGLAVVPWMSIYVAGFAYVAGLSMIQTWQINRPRKKIARREKAESSS
jgi:cellulose synthase/poly-beta-1,6-N-acetylglucosamine synthase-like glycosyltransferase